MALVVRAFPLKPGTTPADVQKFVDELKGARNHDVCAMHAAHGVTHESWYLQETPQGYWVIAVDHAEGDVNESARAFGEENTGFTGWFKQRILELTGVDTSQAPLGPPTIPIYEWSCDEETRVKFEPFSM